MTERQKIAFSMFLAALIAASLLILEFVLPPAELVSTKPLGMAIAFVLLCLAAAIGRLARHRFVSEQDLDPMAGQPSTKAISLQNQVQNTLEQAVIAIGAYGVYVITSPEHSAVIPLTASILFVIGRLAFFAGYEKGSGSRAFGFALTFYPSLVVLALSIYAIVSN